MKEKFRFRKVFAGSLSMLIPGNLFLANPTLAQSGRYNDWHMGRWMMDGWGMGWFGMVSMIMFWGLIIVGLVTLIRWLIQNTNSKGHNSVSEGTTAIDILKERYARGEIDRDEFESMKKDILQ